MKSISIKMVSVLILKPLIRIAFYISHRFYMRLFVRYIKFRGVVLTGTPRYIGFHTVFDDYSKISLGQSVVISDDCHLLTHDYSLTTALRSVDLLNKYSERGDLALVKSIRIGNNVFIGKKSLIMPGAIVEDNVIIGAGSVVRGRLDTQSVYAGNPAKKIADISDIADKWIRQLESDESIVKYDN